MLSSAAARFGSPREILSYLNEYVIGQERAKKSLAVAMLNHHLRVQAFLYHKKKLQHLEEEDERVRKETEDKISKEPHTIRENNEDTRCNGESAEKEKSQSKKRSKEWDDRWDRKWMKVEGEEETRCSESVVVPEKSNVLLVGPSGSGKTLLSKHLAESCGLPFTIFDCSTLTSSGYVGRHAEDIIRDLMVAAGDDVDGAEHGVVVLDEIDKLRKASNGGDKDVNGLAAQQGLLKLIEGKKVCVNGRLIDTTNVLFIAAGAFIDLDNTVHYRLKYKEDTECILKKKDPLLLQHVQPQDLIEYGMIPELIGRIPVTVALDPFNEELLIQALTGTKTCILKQYQWIFRAYGVSMDMTASGIREVAQQAVKQRTGARGLRTIMEKVLLDAMYEVPGSDVAGFVLTDKNVRMEEAIMYVKKEDARLDARNDGTTNGNHGAYCP